LRRGIICVVSTQKERRIEGAIKYVENARTGKLSRIRKVYTIKSNRIRRALSKSRTKVRIGNRGRIKDGRRQKRLKRM